MKALILILTLSAIMTVTAVMALARGGKIDARPELLSDWSDELLEDEIMNYYDAITDLKDEQKRRTSPVKTY